MERGKKLSVRYFLIICMLAVSLLAAAGTSAGSLHASAASINKKSVKLIKGQSAKLKITGTKKKVKWSSSKKSVAVVTSSGKITAKRKGTAIITAKVGSSKYKCKVTVYNTLTVKQAEKAVAAYCNKQGYQFWYSTEIRKDGNYNIWVHYRTGAQGKYVVNRKTGKVNIYEPYGFSSIKPEKTGSFSALKYM